MSSLNLLDSNSLTSQDDSHDEKITLTETIKVPVEKYPRYNFVGRILGPRGMTAKQLEEETGCKIMVRGRGSSRVLNKRECNGEVAPLHVVIQCEDFKSRAHQKMKNAVDAISQLLHPPPEGKDELKRKQLIELSIINGTYRPTSATKIPQQSPRVLSQHTSSTDSNPESESTRIISSLIDSSAKHSRVLGYNQKRFDPIPDQSSQQLASMAHILSMLPPMQQQAINSYLLSEYYKYLLSFPPSPDPKNISSFMPTQPLEAFNNSASALHPHSIIAQANLQQYLQAAAMLNSVPFIHDGSGDFQKPKRH
ncbi:unnamed protein product [Auanema sp. JU1783]|nr:unnamed protein product [Auanema sp. JU1783]